MDIQKKPKLAEKQAFWAEQLPNFESKYWLPSHFEFLAFDMDHGNYVIKDDLDPRLEDDANEIFHRVNTGWAMWKKAVNFTVNEAQNAGIKALESYGIVHNQLTQTQKYLLEANQEVEQIESKYRTILIFNYVLSLVILGIVISWVLI